MGDGLGLGAGTRGRLEQAGRDTVLDGWCTRVEVGIRKCMTLQGLGGGVCSWGRKSDTHGEGMAPKCSAAT